MSSSHYIRTIHTSFTAAHPNHWAARSAAGPLLTSTSSPMHSQPLYSSSSPSPQQHQPVQAPLKNAALAPPASGAGGRRRAYAFRVPSTSPSVYGAAGQKPKFDPFADEPTSPVPSIAHLASLSTPPTPRLAAASLPPHRAQGSGYPGSHQGEQRRRQPQQYVQGQQQGYNQGFYGGYYGGHQHQHQPRRSGFPGQRSRSPAPSFVLDSPSATAYSAHGPTEVYRSTSARAQAWDSHEFEFDNGFGRRGGGNGGLLDPQPQVQVQVQRVSGPAPRRSPSPPQPIARRSPSPPSPSYTRQTQPPARHLTPPSPPPPPQKSAAQIQADKDAKARLVAGILLNRIHVPKTGRARRVPSPVGEKRVYRPSGLRKCVAVAA